MDNVTRLLMQGAAGAGGSTYVDDVFSTYLYEGNETARTINNGVDTTKGAMVWVKNRDNASFPPYLYDTERGTNKQLRSSSDAAQTSGTNTLTAYNNNGISLGTDTMINRNGDSHVAWSFRKAPGFFDVVKYTGSNTEQNIAHNLGCVPGCIIVKRIDQGSGYDWAVLHRGFNEENPGTHVAWLNLSNAAGANSNYWDNTAPTSTHFCAKAGYNQVNTAGGEYIAYLFAGGESTAATARSVNFTGTGNGSGSQPNLSLASSSDFAYGTGDFTIEAWLKPDNSAQDQVFFDHGVDNPMLGILSGKWQYYNSTTSHKYAGTPCRGAWTHFAVSRQSGTTRFFINGDEKISFSDTHNYGAQAASIGSYNTGTYGWNGGISNVRVVKGTAVYTSSFNPPTKPLTNITNTKLLCCNDSSPTGSTVTPGTITNNNSVTASTNSPFDDPEGFKFGEGGDQNLIKCGSFMGTGSDQKVYLGFEPQWFLWKQSSGSSSWIIFDSMRGIVSGGNDAVLYAESTAAEVSAECISLDPDGVTFKGSAGLNPSGQTIIYIAIRSSDGYVGKPPELGTGVFAMDTGASSGFPRFDSNFPVDFGVFREPAAVEYWYNSARLIGPNTLRLDHTGAEEPNSVTNKLTTFDSNTGWNSSSGTSYQSWMWKRHAGFDVVAYDGQTATIKDERHSLNAVPEMMWIKARTGQYAGSANWFVYHKDLNGGTNPENYTLNLNTNGAESSSGLQYWQRQPTSTHFSHGNTGGTGYTGWTYIAMLFASVEGISKVGYYTGTNGSASPGGDIAQTITTGFSPRFVIIKRVDSANNWLVLDTTRGWGAGGDANLFLDESWAQSSFNFGAPTSTGFGLTYDEFGYYNSNGGRYIYYAHA